MRDKTRAWPFRHERVERAILESLNLKRTPQQSFTFIGLLLENKPRSLLLARA